MFGEKDLIYFAAVLFKTTSICSDEAAIQKSLEIYEKIFGHISDDALRKEYLGQQ